MRRCCCHQTPTIPPSGRGLPPVTPLIAAPQPQPGDRLIDAVALMDKLRTNGPWESEQTHDSLPAISARGDL